MLRLREKDNAQLAAAGRSIYERQLRCLKIMCPPPSTVRGKPIESLGKVNESGQLLKQTMSKPAPKLEKEEQQDASEAEDEMPAMRKVQRPSAIRRPKLIGKSVDGAAMQAVAASRARASSNRFRGNVGKTATITATSTRQMQPSSSPSSNQDAKTDTAASKPPSGSSLKEENMDDDCLRLRKEFELEMVNSTFSRRSTSQVAIIRNLTNRWWPTNQLPTKSLIILDFFLSHSGSTWDTVYHLPVMPRGLLNAFVCSFAPWIEGQNKGARLVYPLRSEGISLERHPAVLTGVVRRVRSCKCFAVARLSLAHTIDGSTLWCHGYVLTAPRQSLTRKPVGLTQLERDSAGLTKAADDFQVRFTAQLLVNELST